MGFEITQNQIGSVKQIQFELDTAALLLNTFPLPIKPTNAVFIGGYVITSGGTIPLSAGSFSVQGDNSNFTFLRVTVNGILGLNVLYTFNLQPAQIFTPQTPETYSLNWTYAAGNGRAKVVILYSEYL